MADEKELRNAKLVFDTLCTTLDEHDWKYEKLEDSLSIHCIARGEDLPIEIVIRVDADRSLISLLSPMPYNVPQKRRTETAIAVIKANYGMVNGCFDFDYLKGKILFRLVSSYRESLIGKELFNYMLMCACVTIDEYNDKLLMVAKSEMTVEEILNFIK